MESMLYLIGESAYHHSLKIMGYLPECHDFLFWNNVPQRMEQAEFLIFSSQN